MCAILLSVFASFFWMWILNKLPQVWHPFLRLARFGRVNDDAFLIGIEARDRRFDAEGTAKLLKDAGAIAVEPCHLEADPARRTMPRWIAAFIVSTTAFALIPFAIAAKARNSTSTEVHLHIFPDMDFQPKYKSDTAMDLFADGRANRGEITGTVARGQLNVGEAQIAPGPLALPHKGDFPVSNRALGYEHSTRERGSAGPKRLRGRLARSLGGMAPEEVVQAPAAVRTSHDLDVTADHRRDHPDRDDCPQRVPRPDRRRDEVTAPRRRSGNQEIELQQVEYEAGGTPMLRLRIRERGARFTIFDVDPVTARFWADIMTRWAEPLATDAEDGEEG